MQRLRLLVVDDDPLNQSMISVMLAPQGYTLDFASNGAEALEAVKSQHFDLVFMDLMLPDMNGREVCRQIREWEAGSRHVPIVAVTGFDLPGQPLELVKAGMDDYLFKPFNVRGLTRMIKLYAADGRSDPGAGGSEPQADTPEALVLDYNGSLLDFSNDVAGYEELLKDFIASLPGRLERLRQALDARDFERLSRDAHSLKGVAAGLGALQLSGLATHLGKLSARANQAEAAKTLREMERGIIDLETEARMALQS